MHCLSYTCGEAMCTHTILLILPTRPTQDWPHGRAGWAHRQACLWVPVKRVLGLWQKADLPLSVFKGVNIAVSLPAKQLLCVGATCVLHSSRQGCQRPGVGIKFCCSRCLPASAACEYDGPWLRFWIAFLDCRTLLSVPSQVSGSVHHC